MGPFEYPQNDDLSRFTKSLCPVLDPDRCPSSSIYDVVNPAARDLAFVIEIKADYGKRLGVLVIRSRGDEKGRLHGDGVSLFTDDEIRGITDLDFGR